MSYVAEPAGELEIDVGALIADEGEDEHWKWPSGALHVGDEILIRIVDHQRPDDPVERRREGKAFAEEREREYFEHLKQEYEPDR